MYPFGDNQGATMRINSAKDIGLLIRDRRRSLDQTQQELADRAGVGRPWLSEVERGKRRAELSLVLRVLRELGILLDASVEKAPAHGSAGVLGAPDATRQSIQTGDVEVANSGVADIDIDTIVDAPRGAP
jgi:HTH-type transcriptional regulator/antitoxin HipB